MEKVELFLGLLVNQFLESLTGGNYVISRQ